MTKRGASHGHSRAARRARQRKQLIGVGVIVGIAVLLIVGGMALGGAFAARPEVSQERLERDPILGDPGAPVTIIEYGAYLCPSCRAWHNSGIIEYILEKYPGKVRFIFRDFPVVSPAYEHMAAEIAQCALDQDEEKFWAFHHALYTVVTPPVPQERLFEVGEMVGLDVEALRACARAHTHRATVQYDENRGRQLGLRGAPAFLVNNQLLYSPSPEELQQAVEAALDS